MSIPTGFVRARKSLPCPVCGKPDWCLVAQDGTAAICARIESKRPCGEAGWKHVLTESSSPESPLPAWSAARRAELARMREAEQQAQAEARASIDFPGLARTFAADLTIQLAQQLADDLGLSAGVLRELNVGIARDYRMRLRPDDEHPQGRVVSVNAWSFPMRNGVGEIVGLTFRTRTGAKFRHTYTDNNGLFIPEGIGPIMGRAGQIFSPEGPTSAAALRCLGLRAVGRPNNRLGALYLADYCRRIRPYRLIIVGDNDRQFSEVQQRWIHPGLEGANAVAEAVRPLLACPVYVALPPDGVKDSRVWLHLGVGRANVLKHLSPQQASAAEGVCA